MVWEYKVVKLPAEGEFFGGKANIEKLDAQLNSLGREGWELVTALDTNEQGGASRDLVLFLKRPRKDGA
jgi:hypothetical protein